MLGPISHQKDTTPSFQPVEAESKRPSSRKAMPRSTLIVSHCDDSIPCRFPSRIERHANQNKEDPKDFGIFPPPHLANVMKKSHAVQKSKMMCETVERRRGLERCALYCKQKSVGPTPDDRLMRDAFQMKMKRRSYRESDGVVEGYQKQCCRAKAVELFSSSRSVNAAAMEKECG